MQNPLINIATKAARAAGDLTIRYANRLDKIKIVEKQKNDFVTEVDKIIEQEIIYHIQKAFPDHNILSEEAGKISTKKSHLNDYLWIIDPLDGTTNFINGIPHYSVSIAFCEKNVPQIGVIYDPIRNDLFTCSKGSGAYCNEKRIRVNQAKQLNQAILATGFPYRNQEQLEEYLLLFKKLFTEIIDMRRAGSAALDLAYVAAGKYHGFWEIGLEPWDTAAGVLMVTEAGGTAVDFLGKPYSSNSDTIIAGNIRIVEQLQKLATEVFKTKTKK